MDLPCVFTIAGSDSGGGAGIQADLKTITVLGGYAMSAVTALTAQNTLEVLSSWPVPSAFVLSQIKAVATDLPVHAVKTGMLANREIIEAVAQGLQRYQLRPFVLDPVLVAKGGHPLLAEEDVESLVSHLFPLADLITPNLPEAELISQLPVDTDKERKTAAHRLHQMGARAVLIKGGHGTGKRADDLLFDGEKFHVFSAPRLNTTNTHGTGCTYSAAIATFLARGLPLPEAIRRSKQFITNAIRFSLDIGKGHGPANPNAAAFRDAQRHQVLEALQETMLEIQRHPELRHLAPEVQTNLGFALPFALGPEEVAAFPGRIVRVPEGLRPFQPPAFGASRHVASIILATMKTYPEARAAMNIRMSEEILSIANNQELTVVGFDRGEEPDQIKGREGSTLEWGTMEAIHTSHKKPDLIFDHGEVGKEPMIRILGTDPQDVLRKLLLLV